MAQLRIGLAQVDSTVGDLVGNADLVSRWTAHARRAGLPPRGVPRDGAHRLPAGGPRAAPVVRAGQPRRARGARRGGCRTRARATSPSSSATAAAASGPPPRSAGPPASRRTAPRSCTAAGSSRATPSTTCRTTASSTSSATSCAATGCRSCGVHGVDVATVVCEDLWQEGGPVRVARAASGRARRLHQRLAVRARQGRRARAARRAPGRRGRRAARLRQLRRRAGRAGLRRRLARRRRRRRASSPARRCGSRA